MWKTFCADVLLLFLTYFNAAFGVSNDAVNFECAQDDTGCDVPAHDPVVKCGTFIKYNPWNFRTLPDIKGFAGGVSFNGLTQYVGFGNNYCGTQAEISCPAAIQTKGRAGGYMFCGSSMNVDRFTAFFLQNHTDLKWVDTNTKSMFNVSDVLELPGPYYKYFFARIMYNGEYRLGKVYTTNKDKKFGFYVQNEKRVVMSYERFQVLTCPRCKNGGKGRYCCKNNANNPDCCENGGYGPKCTWRCGQQLLLSQFNPHDPKTAGFPVGNFYDGSTVFVGTGFYRNSDSTRVARISTEKNGTAAAPQGPGAYTDDGSKNLIIDSETARYFINHSKLEWLKIKIGDGPPKDAVLNYYHYGYSDGLKYFARLNLKKNKTIYQEIGSYLDLNYPVRAPDWTICYWNGKKSYCERKQDYEFDILVCRQTFNIE